MPAGVAQMLTVVATLFAVASFVGLGYTRGRVTALREELRDEREGRSSDRDTIKELRSDLTVARNDLAALGRVVTAEAHWVAIGDQLNEHHVEAKAYWARTESTANATLAALKELGHGGIE